MHEFDSVVIGGGHAGIEACGILNQLKIKTLLLTNDKHKIGFPSCNPSIGGIGKSHLVYEIDVFGGIMPRVADKTGLHHKLLNSSKGPAVWSLRTQIDSDEYPKEVLSILKKMDNFDIMEDEATEIITENGQVKGIKTASGKEIKAKTVIIATGTFLGGRIFIGKDKTEGGRYNENPSNRLSDYIKNMGFETIRLKTGTSPRICGKTMDIHEMEIQSGEENTGSFCVLNNDIVKNRTVCYVTRTNLRTHRIIKDNLSLSALYSGMITGKGPRYCPSLEDKVVRFEGRDSHTLFIEPMGISNDVFYVNGASSSLPIDLQYEFIRTIDGLKRAEFSQPGYAIEYTAVKTTEINNTLETKKIRGLFLAGQINGTSGYEEAAAQGLVAGINSAMAVKGLELKSFDRFTSYIGVLTDDLIKKDITEPYRLFTSRAENRLALRQDNAFKRMMKYAEDLKISSPSFLEYKKIDSESDEIKTLIFKKEDYLNAEFEEFKNPSVGFDSFSQKLPMFSRRAKLFAYSEIKYHGYINRYKKVTEKILNYSEMNLFSFEKILNSNIVTKETKEIIKKKTIKQVKDLFGLIDPSDIENIIIFLKKSKD